MRSIVRIMGTITLLEDNVPDLSETDVQAAVRSAFEQLARGRAVQPSQIVTDLPDGGDVITYQAALAEEGVFAVKLSPYLPQPDGPATVTAWTLLLSIRTGQPLLLVDAGALTAERTAATTAVAVELLARPDARRLAVIGLGPLGRAHVRHVRTGRGFQQVRVYAESLTPGAIAGLGDVQLVASAEEAVSDADVVLLCTSAAKPVIDVRELTPGTLVTSISTNAPLAHEVDPRSLLDLDVYADHAATAFAHAGDMRIAVEQHGFTAEHIRGDLPGLLSGRAPRPSGDRVVFFRSVGLGIEDAAIALAALNTVERQS